MSFLALASNVALAAYQYRRVRKLRLHPLKDEIFVGTKAYERALAENR